MLRNQYKPFGFYLFFGFAFLFMAFQCNKHSASACINQKIAAFQSDCCANGASVVEYTFQQQHVFVFNYGSCGADLPAYVLTENCDTLGFLGGIAGNTIINGDDFSSANQVGVVWEN